MSEPYVGEIRMFAGTFAPRGWAYCDGQLLAVSQNDVLFSLLGTIYGGDGRTTFGLPDLRSRIPLHQGTGPGLSPRRLGSRGGSESETLTANQLPSHSHDFHASSSSSTEEVPVGRVVADTTQTGLRYLNNSTPDSNFSSAAIDNTGGSQRHTNLMPSLCIHYIVALMGIYPTRS